jgi:Peptidase C39 family
VKSVFAHVPASLLSLESSCGVICAWLVLRHFRKTVSIKRLIRLCKFTKSEGTYAVALAVALRQFGLPVIFLTDEDNDKKPIEIIAYKQAKKLNIRVLPGPTIRDLNRYLRQGKVVVALFDTKDGVAHFSLVREITGGRVFFDDPIEPEMSTRTFNKRRAAAGICRHTIVIG